MLDLPDGWQLSPTQFAAQPVEAMIARVTFDTRMGLADTAGGLHMPPTLCAPQTAETIIAEVAFVTRIGLAAFGVRVPVVTHAVCDATGAGHDRWGDICHPNGTCWICEWARADGLHVSPARNLPDPTHGLHLSATQCAAQPVEAMTAGMTFATQMRLAGVGGWVTVVIHTVSSAGDGGMIAWVTFVTRMSPAHGHGHVRA